MKDREVLNYLSEVKRLGSNYGLERTVRLLELIGNPHKELKLIHIAGTNGKGSTSSMVGRLLRGKGFNVGSFNSPHLEEIEEIIKINEENIKEEDFEALIKFIKPYVDKVILEGFGHPTEFEIFTCLMLYYFKEKRVDFGVIEVGLGGRMDSTNVITPILSIITSISLDHLNILGDTISKIAYEKSGIIKEGVPLILYPQSDEAEKVVLEKAKKENSKVYNVNKEDGKLIKLNSEDKTQEIIVKGGRGEYEISLPLLGTHQILNCALAIRAFEVLSEIEGFEFTKNDVQNSLKSTKWIGRLEVLNSSPLVVIDAAHNIEGIKGLVENVKTYFKYEKLYLILGILADKQVGEMIETLAPLTEKIYALTPHNDRAELGEDLKKEIEKVKSNVVSYESYEDGFKAALKDGKENDMILVTGSIYMIGDMRRIIRNSL